MAKPNIIDYRDLMVEKERLKNITQRSRDNIRNSIIELKHELNPFYSLGKFSLNGTAGKSSNPLIQYGISRAADFLVGGFLLKKAGWLPRLLVSFTVKEASKLALNKKVNPKLAETLHGLAKMLRKTDALYPAANKKAKKP